MKRHKPKKLQEIRFRVSTRDKDRLDDMKKDRNFSTRSSMIRTILLKEYNSPDNKIDSIYSNTNKILIELKGGKKNGRTIR